MMSWRDNAARFYPAEGPGRAVVAVCGRAAGWRAVAMLALLVLVAGCGNDEAASAGGESASAAASAAKPPQWFEEVTQTSGLNFTLEAGETESYFMPKIMGSGGTTLDADGDGRLDLYLVVNAGPDHPATNKLYLQKTPGQFVESTAGTGLDLPGYWQGAAAGDLNNDNRPDIILTGYAEFRVLMNLGNLRFHDVTASIGERMLTWGASIGLLDYDRDGKIDLAVADYVQYEASKGCIGDDGQADYCTPTGLSYVPNRLYRNVSGPEATADPSLAKFQDVTTPSGIGESVGVGLGVLTQDFNGDGWVDILFGNDGRPNHLWINQGDGTFVEEAVARGIAVDVLGAAEANMGIAAGDARNVGLFDIYIGHLPSEGNTYWMQVSPGLFEDRTGPLGLNNLKWKGTTFGTVMRDFDNDGWSDLAMNGGRIRRPPPSLRKQLPQTFWGQFAEYNQVLRNDGGKRFTDISPNQTAFSGFLNVGRGLIGFDYDDDGGVDLLATEIAGPARLFRNVAARGNWLTVRTIDPSVGGRDAYGTAVLARYDGTQHLSLANPGYSYMVGCDPRAHFGLGKAGRVDELQVTWPDGTVERFGPYPVNQVLTLSKGSGTAVATPVAGGS